MNDECGVKKQPIAVVRSVLGKRIVAGIRITDRHL